MNGVPPTAWRARLDTATKHLDPPLAVVDLEAFDQNSADLVRRAGGPVPRSGWAGHRSDPGPASQAAGHPDRPASRPAHEIRGILVERVEVDHGQRRVKVLGGRVQPGAPRIGGHAIHGTAARL